MQTTSLKQLLDDVDGIPTDSAGPVFNEPWEADTFAMTLSAHEQGLFTWTEWANCLSAAILDAQREGDKDNGDTYYQHWLTAFENILVEKSVTDRTELQTLYDAWDSAARSTPHGEPIVVER